MSKSDVVVVGGGHNGLVAAILAAQAGKSVTLLERSAQPGGATAGQALFPPHLARLSRYSYLIALMPDHLVRRLGIALPLLSRTVSSYTPVRRNGLTGGLLVEREPGPATEQSFADLTGGSAEYRSWTAFYAEMHSMAAALAPILAGPLVRRAVARDAVIAAAGEQIWTDIVEEPLGAMILRRFQDDTVRGVVATDGLIGTYTSLLDPELLANRCFLYHLIGRGSGEWLVPVGGMGALTDSLVAKARSLNVDIRCETAVLHVDETRSGVTVSATGAAGEGDRGGTLFRRGRGSSPAHDSLHYAHAGRRGARRLLLPAHGRPPGPDRGVRLHRARRSSLQALRAGVPSRGVGHRVQHDGARAQTLGSRERGEPEAWRGVTGDVDVALARQEAGRGSDPVHHQRRARAHVDRERHRPMSAGPSRPGLAPQARRSRPLAEGASRSPTRYSGRSART